MSSFLNYSFWERKKKWWAFGIASRILSSAASLALSYFATSSHKRHGFRKKFFDHKMCVFVFFTTFVRKKVSQRRIQQDMIISSHTFSRKVHAIVTFSLAWIFSSDKILKYQISLKSVHWKPCCSMRTDRHDEDNSRFSAIFANVPKKSLQRKWRWNLFG